MAKAIQVYQDSPVKQNVDCDTSRPQHFIDAGRNDFSDSVLKHGEDSDCYITSSSLSSSCSSSKLEDDASSPSFSPLFHLSDLMAQLPIKRGLSKYYDGKSESFTSLASVGNLEDIVKKGKSCSQRIKSCRSNGWGLGDCPKYGPKATITKRTSANSKRSYSSNASCRTSLFMKKNF